MNIGKGKLGHTLQRVAEGAHLSTPRFFEPAKRPDDRADWAIGRMVGWEDGRMERWKGGRMRGWKDGRMGGWKINISRIDVRE